MRFEDNFNDEQYYDALISMFASDGWKLYIEKKRDQFEAMKNSWADHKDLNEFFVAKGRMIELQDVLAFETLHREAAEELNADV